MEFLESNIFLIALTFLVFWGARKLQQRTGWVALNPILVTIFVLIAYLKVTGISFETYNESGRMIEFWLKPAIVALGVPLYTQLKAIRRQLLPILLSQLAGCVAGIISVVLVAKAMGASTAVIISMAPKSVTTPIAMEVVAPLGGIPSLTAAIVICVGLFGRNMRLQSAADRPCEQSYSQKHKHGYRGTRLGNHPRGRMRPHIWRICQPRPHSQRHTHRHAHSEHT